jgi:hypothetical protein
VITAGRGVPFGTSIACFLANFYLIPLDRRLQAIPGLSYFRYADDMLAATRSREAALKADTVFSTTLAELKLGSKPAHHRNFAFLKSDEDAEFEPVDKFRHLGLEFRKSGSIGLSRDKARKIRNLFRYAFRRARARFRRADTPRARASLAVDLSRKLVEEGFRSVAIIDYYLKHVNDEAQLRLLDRWLAEEILAMTFQDGHRRGHFRELSFKKLREMGLPSLRHRHRQLRHGHLQSSFFVLRTEKLIEQRRRRLSPGAPKGKAGFSPDREAAVK